MNNAIGSACKLIGVPDAAIRSCTLKTANAERLGEVCRHNIAALGRMVEYNHAVGIRMFRISSDLIPLATHPDMCFPWREECAEGLAAVGRRICETGLRVSMHPGQYTVLNSPDGGVAERAVADIAFHADILDLLGTGGDAKIILHVGGVYGDRKAATERFAKNFGLLPGHAARRLIIENDERNYPVDEVYDLAVRLGIPVVMDVFHHKLLPAPEGTTVEWLERCAGTWKAGDGRQKIHYSQQLQGGKPGMHSRTIEVGGFVEFYKCLSGTIPDIMLEVKDKNLSALKCLHCVDPATNRAVLTEAWAQYKYAVLEHSQSAYTAVRNLLKDQRPSPVAFYQLVEKALARAASHGSVANAAEHVWGYFKTRADAKERSRFETLLAKADEESGNAAMKRHLYRMAEKYGEEYLLNSLYFFLPSGPI